MYLKKKKGVKVKLFNSFDDIKPEDQGFQNSVLLLTLLE